MIRLIVALGRSLPLAIALAVIAVGIYFFVSWRRSPARAKEILIKVFLVLCSVLSGAFLLVSAYALIDGNMAVFELAASCMVVGLVGLAITLICRYFFRKHNPHYKYEPTAKARPISNKPDMLNAVTKILNFINDNRRRR